MSNQIRIIQNYNQELAKHIEHLRVQNDELNFAIEQDEEEKLQIEKRLKSVNLKIAEKKKTQHIRIIQNYNQELAKHMEHLRVQNDELNFAIEQDEEEKLQIEKRLKSVNLKIAEKKKTQQALKNTMDAAESGLIKIVESSEVLLSLVQRESEALKF